MPGPNNLVYIHRDSGTYQMRKHKFHNAPISHIFKVKEGSLMGVSDQDLMEKITAGAAENCETFSLQIHS